MTTHFRENSMDKEAWRATVHGIKKSQMLLSTHTNTTVFPFTCWWTLSYSFYSFYLLLVILSEKAMAPQSSTLACKIPWMEEPGRLQSMGSPRVRHNWATSLSLFPFIHWRRKWQPTPVFSPGESQGRGNLVGCHLWGHTESDTTKTA